MAKYERLLVAVDGSEPSLHALRQSFNLTNHLITVLTVVPPYTGDLRFVGVKDIESVLDAPRARALAAIQELARISPVALKVLCTSGEPHEKIVAAAADEECDLIVLGVKGWDEIDHLLMSSTAARVIGASAIDVLIVPHGAAAGWGRFLLATDGSPANRAALFRAVELARAYSSELFILYVIDLPPGFYTYVPAAQDVARAEARDCLLRAQKIAASLGVEAQTHFREGDSSEQIIRFARDQQISAIIMGTHGRTGLTRLLMGSTTERVTGFAPCPVLVVR